MIIDDLRYHGLMENISIKAVTVKTKVGLQNPKILNER